MAIQVFYIMVIKPADPLLNSGWQFLVLLF